MHNSISINLERSNILKSNIHRLAEGNMKALLLKNNTKTHLTAGLNITSKYELFSWFIPFNSSFQTSGNLLWHTQPFIHTNILLHISFLFSFIHFNLMLVVELFQQHFFAF